MFKKILNSLKYALVSIIYIVFIPSFAMGAVVFNHITDRFQRNIISIILFICDMVRLYFLFT